MPGVNRYDRAPQRLYISLYVPIPFDELYKIGKANNEATEKALENLTTNMNKWAEFYSPSLVDMKNWYDLTVGQGSQIASELASNPDLIKTPEGRSRILSFINNRPYYLLSLLKLGAAALNERKKNEADLMKSNRYNPTYHAFDYTNYNTLENGVLNDTSLLPWYTMPEIVKPYVDQIKDSYLGSLGGYDYTGVSSLMVLDQINKYRSDILKTPAVQMLIDDLVKNYGQTTEDAEAAVMQDAITAALAFAHLTRTPNAYAFANYKGSGGSGKNQQAYMPTDYDTFTISADTYFNNAVADYYLKNNNKYPENLEALINYKIGDKKKSVANYKKALQDIGYRPTQANASEFAYHLIGATENKYKRLVLDNGNDLVPLVGIFGNPRLGGKLFSVDGVKNSFSKIKSFEVYGNPTVIKNGDGHYIVSFDVSIPVDVASEAGLTEKVIYQIGGNVSYKENSQDVSNTTSVRETTNKGSATKSTTNKKTTEKYYIIPVLKEFSGDSFNRLAADTNSFPKSSATHLERSNNVEAAFNTDNSEE